MENKYFIPDIEDICIGYEYERFVPKANATEEECWEKLIMSVNYLSLDDIDNEIIEKEIRVPYLTKEHIEAEGWELIQIYPKGACIFQKGTKEEGCELTCDFTEHRVHFTKLYFYGLDDEYTRTKLTWRSLECKDINTFRKIIKLLGI